MSYYWRMTGSLGFDRALTGPEYQELCKLLKDNFSAEGEDTTDMIGDDLQYIKFNGFTVDHFPHEINQQLIPFLMENDIRFGGEGEWSNEEWEAGFWEVDVDKILLYHWKTLYNDLKEELKESRKKYRELKLRMFNDNNTQ